MATHRGRPAKDGIKAYILHFSLVSIVTGGLQIPYTDKKLLILQVSGQLEYTVL